MAHRLKAIQAKRPRIKYGDPTGMLEVVNYIADRTGVNEGTADLVMKESRDAIIFFNRAGRAVTIEGIGTFRPNIALDGKLNIVFKMDKVLKNRLNAPGERSMKIINKDNIDKTPEDLIALWDEENPTDPVV